MRIVAVERNHNGVVLGLNNEGTQAMTSHDRLFLFQKVMFWSLVPAILVVPVWMVAGRQLMGGPGGWGGVILMWTVAPVLLLHHIILLEVMIRSNKRVGNNRSNHRSSSMRDCGGDFCVSVRLAHTLFMYYAAHFFLQVFMDDGGDQGAMGSWAFQYLGVKSSISDTVDACLAVMILVLLVVQMVFAGMDDPVLLLLPPADQEHLHHHHHHHRVPTTTTTTTESSSVV
eukprot:scaffold75523_cov38-Attheya_sp.AAC.2